MTAQVLNGKCAGKSQDRGREGAGSVCGANDHHRISQKRSQGTLAARNGVWKSERDDHRQTCWQWQLKHLEQLVQ